MKQIPDLQPSESTAELLGAMSEVERLSDDALEMRGPWGHGNLKVRTCPDCRPPECMGFGGVIGWGDGPASCICDPPKRLEDMP